MKGIVFTEFQEMVEETFGIGMLDTIIEAANLPSGGAYTAVGTYDYQELIQLVVNLSQETGTPVPALVKAFGHHFFKSLAAAYSEMLKGLTSAIELLANVEDYIHVEVLKLYPQAELPRFEFKQLGENRWEIDYFSSRPFADLAEGLMEAAIEHFGDPLKIDREDIKVDHGSAARFVITATELVHA